MFFHQEAGLDAPAVARAEVAAFVDVVSREGAAGEPGMASDLGDALPLLAHLLPALLADHDMEVQALAARLDEFPSGRWDGLLMAQSLPPRARRTADGGNPHARA
jgi:hypothetical protein